MQTLGSCRNSALMCQFRPTVKRLLLNAVNLTSLSTLTCFLPHMAVMQKLSLCPLSLRIWTAEHPLNNSLAYIRVVPYLETVSLTSPKGGAYAANSLLLPQSCLQAMSTLKLLGSKGCIFRASLILPQQCQVHPGIVCSSVYCASMQNTSSII